MQGEGQQVNNDGLHQSPEPCGYRLSENQRPPAGGRNQEFMDYPQVALPDHRDAVEYGAEEHALGQDPGCHEGDVTQLAGRHAPHAADYLAEDDKPEDRLGGP